MFRKFFGGVHPNEGKSLTENCPIAELPAPEQIFIPVSLHIGAPCEPIVSVGDHVNLGQLIAKATAAVSADIHASVSGTISAIEPRLHANGKMVLTIVINNDMQDTVDESVVPHTAELENDPKALTEIVRKAGIVGMGGAAFPTAVKITSGLGKVDNIIINAAECEPYLNCDNRIMIERTKEFVEGVRLLATACGVQHVYIGIEENKPEAYAALVALDGVVTEKGPITPGDIVVVNLKAKYPQGAEKTLIYACTKRKVPTGGLPAAVGCIVNNVATAYAVWDAVVNGRPLYKRVMTLSGRGIRRPMNIEVRVGTPLASIVEMCDNITDDTVKLVMGGPMMGFTLADLDVTTTKTDSGFLALTDKEASTLLPTPCIRCGRCVDICPMQLTPLMIDFYATVGDFKNALKYGAMNCFECGSCAYVCPAKRPLVQSIRLTKAKAKEIK